MYVGIYVSNYMKPLNYSDHMMMSSLTKRRSNQTEDDMLFQE